MSETERSARILAVSLAALAGFVDAIGFLHLGGFFVSFMSGNSTRLAVALGERSRDAAVAASLLACFVVGVVAGSLLGHAAGRRRRSGVMALAAALLAAAAALTRFGHPSTGLAVTALAMGAMNATFERDDDIPFGVTYMTGALVKAGQRLALALRGGSRTAWIPFALLWAGLTAGAVAGAAAYGRLGLDSLFLAVAGAALLSAIAAYGEATLMRGSGQPPRR